MEAHKLHRKTDPLTSRSAANQVELFSMKHEDIILNALRLHGDMTADEIAMNTPLDPVQINRRLAGMKAKGIAEPTGKTRSSLSGRPERVWGVA